MFISKKDFDLLQFDLLQVQEDFDLLQKDFVALKASKTLIECKKCGCVILKHEKNKGNVQMNEKFYSDYWVYPSEGHHIECFEDYVHYDYYCKRCNPKFKKKKKKKKKK